MAKTALDKPLKDKPEWLQKILQENLEEANRLFEARNQFVGAKLQFEQIIEDINSKYGTEYQIADVFSIKPEEEETAMDMLDLNDEDDD